MCRFRVRVLPTWKTAAAKVETVARTRAKGKSARAHETALVKVMNASSERLTERTGAQQAVSDPHIVKPLNSRPFARAPRTVGRAQSGTRLVSLKRRPPRRFPPCNLPRHWKVVITHVRQPSSATDRPERSIHASGAGD